MPRSDPMNWDRRNSRWRRMYKRTLYTVYAHELGGSNQENSRAAMRVWWERKLAEIRPVEFGEDGIVRNVIVPKFREQPATPPPEPKRKTKPQPPAPPPEGTTVGELVTVWLTDRRSEAVAGNRSHENYESLRRAITIFSDHVGKDLPVDRLNAIVWDGWYRYCAGLVALRDRDPKTGWTANTATKYFLTTRQFVTWLWERESIAAVPRNLRSKSHRFERPQITIPVFTNEEISLLLRGAQGQHRLILLLMLNCGMTQTDVADLKISECDLAAGRITRIRSKTSLSKSGRMVSYKLWQQTHDLLKNHIATEGELALVTKSGSPWVWTTLDNSGKYRKSDNVATIFKNLKKRVNLTGEHKTLKIFRKTSATRIKQNRDYSDLRFWFLGHSEATIADRHYAALSQSSLDAAVTWLGTQYDLD